MYTTTRTWQELLADEKQQPYFQEILNFIKQEQSRNVVIYPHSADIFNAFRFTDFANTKVVILGQDPYHGPGQAHGLSFSVLEGISFPPSLQNILRELRADLGIPIPENGNLEKWAKQGVLLLNATLTVEANKPQSHENIGWQRFTDKVISLLNEHLANLVFLLWGSYAQRKASLIDPTKHLILRAPHPSPLSAHRGFFGCKHFSKTNAYLHQAGKESIDWTL